MYFWKPFFFLFNLNIIVILQIKKETSKYTCFFGHFNLIKNNRQTAVMYFNLTFCMVQHTSSEVTVEQIKKLYSSCCKTLKETTVTRVRTMFSTNKCKLNKPVFTAYITFIC